MAKSLAFTSNKPARLQGVGGKGPTVIYDVAISLFFAKTASDNAAIQIVAGVVPDGHFPGDLVLGNSVHHDLGFTALPNKTVQLNLVRDRPMLEGYDSTVHVCSTLMTSTKPADDTETEGHITLQYARPTSIFTTLKSKAIDPNVRDLPKLPDLLPDQITLIDKYTKQLKDEFPTVFKRASKMTESKTRVKHTIDTADNNPIRIPPRRYSHPQLQAMKEFVNTAVDLGILRKSMSPWSAPALLTPKAARTLAGAIIYRFCVDYRMLNKITKKHAFPLPNVEDEIQRAGGHQWYSLFDLENGFWHVLMDEKSIEKTAFSTPFGQFEWLVMPFGLTSSPATFQSLMNEVLTGIESISTLLDDVTTYGNTIEEVYQINRLVLSKLRDYGLVLNTKKCRLFERRIRFLGFILDASGVHSDPDKISAIIKRPPPSTATEVRSFLNAAGYFRHFIKNFSDIARSLYDLTGSQHGKNTKVTLTSEQLEAWTKLRDALTRTPLLKTFDWSKPIVIESDSSDHHIGAVLLQPWPVPYSSQTSDSPTTALHPVAYYSKKLNDTQQRYSAQERELLAIVNSLHHWSHWIEGGDITVITDHESLKQLDTKVEQPRRILRFLDTIQHYSLRIVYRAGKLNVVADWLSRPSTELLTIHTNTVERGDGSDSSTTSTLQAVTYLTETDLVIIKSALLNNDDIPPRLSSFRKHFVSYDNNLHYISTEAKRLLLVPSYPELVDVAKQKHLKQGHCKVGVLQRHIADDYWHPDMLLATHEAIRTCPQCQVMCSHQRLAEPLTPIAPARPLQRWGIDFTGPISGFYILAAIDYATGYVEAVWTTTANQDAVCEMIERLVARYSSPAEMISDNGTAFTGQRTVALVNHYSIKWLFTSPSNPRTNGRVERLNDQLKSLMKRIALEYPTYTKEILLRRALAEYNQAKNMHGYSPHFLLYATTPRSQNDTSLFSSHYIREPTDEEAADHVADLVRKNSTHSQLRDSLASLKTRAADIRMRTQEQKAFFRTYGTGDWVLRERQRKNKFEPNYDGPWQIVAMHAGNTYTLATPHGKHLTSRYNGRLLTPAYVDDGQPVRSLWYANKTLLEEDRRRAQREAASLEAMHQDTQG